MSHFVFALDSGGYVGTRKNNGRMYESRPSASSTLGEARVFNTRAAATRAGSALGKVGVAREVTIALEGARLHEALRWALAELNGTTRYDNDEQRENAFAMAEAVLGDEA